jgi:hypothetical protein
MTPKCLAGFLLGLISLAHLTDVYAFGPQSRIMRVKAVYGTRLPEIRMIGSSDLTGHQVGAGFEYRLSYTILMLESDMLVSNYSVCNENYRNTRLIIPFLINAEFGKNYYGSVGFGFFISPLLGQSFENNDEVTSKSFCAGSALKIEVGMKVYNHFSVFKSANVT